MHPPHPLQPQACGVLVQSNACHPFDEEGPHGFFRAEGMGCVILRRMNDAEAKGNRVLAKVARAIAASAGAADTSLEGAGRVYEQPCPQGMRQMFIRAYSSAGIPFHRLNYMECHATGTAVGDVIEVDAVGAVFGESHDLKTNPIRIASVKSNIGHAEVAAGIFSVIKVSVLFWLWLLLWLCWCCCSVPLGCGHWMPCPRLDSPLSPLLPPFSINQRTNPTGGPDDEAPRFPPHGRREQAPHGLRLGRAQHARAAGAGALPGERRAGRHRPQLLRHRRLLRPRRHRGVPPPQAPAQAQACPRDRGPPRGVGGRLELPPAPLGRLPRPPQGALVACL